jgi:hypothetical protein
MTTNYWTCVLNRRYTKDCQQIVGASQTPRSDIWIRDPVFRIFPTLWDATHKSPHAGQHCWLQPAIPDFSRKRRLAGLRAQLVPFELPDTPSGARLFHLLNYWNRLELHLRGHLARLEVRLSFLLEICLTPYSTCYMLRPVRRLVRHGGD